jgi:hypothetical protein
MKTPIHKITSARLARTLRKAGAIVLACLPFPLNCQTTPYTWSGGGGDSSINTAGNWEGGVAPPNTYTNYIFTGSTNTEVTVPSTGKNLSTLTFDENAGAFIIEGAVPGSLADHRFTFGRSSLSDTIKNQITQNSSHDQSVLATFYIANGGLTTPAVVIRFFRFLSG